MSGLLFNEDRHEYTYDGERVPSVTEICTRGTNKSFYKEGAAERGTAIHATISKALTDNIIVREFEYIGYAQSMFRALEALSAQECVCDVRCFDEMLWYAGTADIVCNIGGEKTIIEIKTGARQKWHDMQVAAYASALSAKAGVLIYFDEIAEYKIQHVDIDRSMHLFCAKLQNNESAETIDTHPEALELEKLRNLIAETEADFAEKNKDTLSAMSHLEAQIEKARDEIAQDIEAIELRIEVLRDALKNKLIIQPTLASKSIYLKRSQAVEIEDETVIPREFLTADIRKIKEQTKKTGIACCEGINVVDGYVLCCKI